tara:strand:- start:4535 stop:4795 length:261 start_codon:yes stop_codon:yes gene_type:complete
MSLSETTVNLSNDAKIAMLIADVDELKKIVKGNGDEGLNKKMVRVETHVSEIRSGIKALKYMIGSLIVSLLAAVIIFTAKVLAASG